MNSVPYPLMQKIQNCAREIGKDDYGHNHCQTAGNDVKNNTVRNNDDQTESNGFGKRA